MAIAIASIMQESNTFSPVKTRYDDFDPVFGQAALDRHAGKLTEMGGFIDVLRRRKREIAPVCAAWAITAGRLVRPDFERLSREFGDALSSIPKPEALLLAMHGAQTAEGEDDVEGHTIGLARRLLGPLVPIVVTLDLHANVTAAMVEGADASLGYHTYQHVDMFEVGSKAASIAARMLDGKCKPAMRWRKVPLIVPAENASTSKGPMARLVRRAGEIEARGQAEWISVFTVQPWMDIHEMGGAVVAVTDGDASAADRHARALAQKLWDTRRDFDADLVPVQDAIREAIAAKEGPVVLAESSDSTGSGSPGDSTGVLKYLVKAPLDGAAAIFVVDPEAVETLRAAGVGATVTLPVGGKFDLKNSKPVRVTGRVRMLSDGRWTPRARGYNPGIEQSMGASAVLECGRVLILIGAKSTMTVDPALFRCHGIDPLYCKIVVVKSPLGFRAAYEPIAKRMMVVDTPGVSTANFARMPWKRLSRPIYPLDAGLEWKA